MHATMPEAEIDNAAWVEANVTGDSVYMEGVRSAARVALGADPALRRSVFVNTLSESLGYAAKDGIDAGDIVELFHVISERNGLLDEIGGEGVQELMAGAMQPQPAVAAAIKPNAARGDVKPNRFSIRMVDEITVGDDPVELVQGILPMGPALGIAFGPPKSLKSFLLTYVAFHIAADREFCGRQVQAGAVVYVTSEGIRGVERRLIAGRRDMGLEGRNVPFALISTMPNLGAGENDRKELQAKISETLQHLRQPLRLIIIDTMRRAMPGKSENEQKDVSVVVDNCEALARAFNCLVFLVHHSPRSTDERGSGSNAVDAAADLMWSVARDESSGEATATVARYKDGEEGDTWSFRLRTLEIATDRDGNPINSCAVEITAEPERKAGSRSKRKPMSGLGKKFYDALCDALAGENVATVRGRKAVSKDDWRREAQARGLIDLTVADKDEIKRNRSLFDKYRLQLITENYVACEGDLQWTL